VSPANTDHPELLRLREENLRLTELLKSHGIPVDAGVREPAAPEYNTGKGMGTGEKVGLFRRLSRGSEDVFARRWESSQGKSPFAAPESCHKARGVPEPRVP